LILQGKQTLQKVIEWLPVAERPLLVRDVAQASGHAPPRAEAVSLLVTFLDPAEAQCTLIEIAQREEDTLARELAVDNLVLHFLDRDVRDILTQIAIDIRDSAARTLAVNALLQHFGADAETRELLQTLARQDRARGINAIEVLAVQFPDSLTRAFLLDLALSNNKEYTKKTAIRCLAQYFPHADTRQLLVRTILQGQNRLSQVVDWLPIGEKRLLILDVAQADGNAPSRTEAITSLVDVLSHEKARSVLTRIVERDEETAARGRAINVLAEHFCDGDTRRILTRITLTNTNSTARGHAVNALLKHFPDRETRELLNKLAREDVSAASLYAIEGLAAHFADLQTRELLLEIARSDERSDAQRTALIRLGNVFLDERTLGLFFDLAFTSVNDSVRATVLSALPWCFGSNDARLQLTEMACAAADANVRSQALVMLVVSDWRFLGADLLRTIAQNAQGRDVITGALLIIQKLKAMEKVPSHALGEAERVLKRASRGG
jgi:hypothetical protein